MQKTLLIIVLAALCLNFRATAQGQNIIKPLVIGDTIPNGIWKIPLQVINERLGKKTITLNDYHNKKLIILDFWATWCGTCIAKFPHIDSLNRAYQNQVQFILVNTSNRDSDKQKVRAFIGRYIANHQALSVPIIHQKKSFNSYFPCHVLPHYVWVGVDGRIKAITEWTEVNKQNIESLIADLPLNLPVKDW